MAYIFVKGFVKAIEEEEEALVLAFCDLDLLLDVLLLFVVVMELAGADEIVFGIPSVRVVSICPPM
jgi:hypothetical protein